MHLEDNFKKSSEMLVVQECRVSEVKLFILIYWKKVRYKFSKFGREKLKHHVIINKKV